MSVGPGFWLMEVDFFRVCLIVIVIPLPEKRKATKIARGINVETAKLTTIQK